MEQNERFGTSVQPIQTVTTFYELAAALAEAGTRPDMAEAAILAYIRAKRAYMYPDGHKTPVKIVES